MPIPLAAAVMALKATKAVANALGTKPTPTPEVKVKKQRSISLILQQNLKLVPLVLMSPLKWTTTDTSKTN